MNLKKAIKSFFVPEAYISFANDGSYRIYGAKKGTFAYLHEEGHAQQQKRYNIGLIYATLLPVFVLVSAGIASMTDNKPLILATALPVIMLFGLEFDANLYALKRRFELGATIYNALLIALIVSLIWRLVQ